MNAKTLTIASAIVALMLGFGQASAQDAAAPADDAGEATLHLGQVLNEQAGVDRVILALPFSVLRTLDWSAAGFGDRKRAAIEQLGWKVLDVGQAKAPREGPFLEIALCG